MRWHQVGEGGDIVAGALMNTHLMSWTPYDHYMEAIRLHEVANHEGHFNADKGNGLMLSAIFHATMAQNSNMIQFEERRRNVMEFEEQRRRGEV